MSVGHVLGPPGNWPQSVQSVSIAQATSAFLMSSVWPPELTENLHDQPFRAVVMPQINMVGLIRRTDTVIDRRLRNVARSWNSNFHRLAFSRAGFLDPAFMGLRLFG
jgi:hypothetical protein